MRRYLILLAAVCVAVGLFAVGMEAAAKPVKGRQGLIETEFDGGFLPKALPKHKPTPISFNIFGKIRSLDPAELHPKALTQFEIEGDKNVTVDVEGVPTCTSGRLQTTTTQAARKACGPAIIGTGTTEVGVLFPDQPELEIHSQLLAFNGGERGGVTTLFVHAFLTSPVTAAVVTTVKIKKIHKGRFGTLSVASIPKIAGGSGSVKFFRLTINKGILWATCPDGHLAARGSAVFSGGTKISAAVTKPCTPKG